jgi:hypothetical protein
MRLIALFNVIAEVDDEVGALDKATVVGRLCFSKVSVCACKFPCIGLARAVPVTAVCAAVTAPLRHCALLHVLAR